MVVALEQQVADAKILNDSVIPTVCEWYLAIRPYVAARSRHQGRNPWQPLEEFVQRSTPKAPAPRCQA